MTAPNRATLWGETLVEELVASGVDAVSVAPGSRSTPLTVAFAAHPDVTVHSHLDERSAAFFALGRSRRTGRPTALVCTSGTAAANFHPAVIEADASRVPLVVLTADRPAELRDSGANQTIDQTDLYGDAVRWQRTLPEPAPEPRRLRSLRTTACRAVATATGTPPGPVHLNVPVAKPLEPTPIEGDVQADFAESYPLAASGREGPFVRTTAGEPTLDAADVATVTEAIATADRGLLVAGPAHGADRLDESLAGLARETGFPLLADPLSGARFGDHVGDAPVCSGYDAYLPAAAEWPDPDVVLRVGSSPTSKACRRYLRDADARQFVVDPAGGWPEAEFTATDLLVAAPDAVATAVADGLAERRADDEAGRAGDDSTDDAGGAGASPGQQWRERFATAEATYWDAVESAVAGDASFEGAVATDVVDALPDPATLFVSNSMPVRDVDRFARDRPADLTVLGNRGASGIDGIVSGGLGAASATDEPVVVLLGDLACYHDANGLLAVDRCDVDATFVVLNNDGGGIFHKLPIESFDPPFTDQFRTPHGLSFDPLADLYGLAYERVDAGDDVSGRVADAVESTGSTILEVECDAAASHRTRERLAERVREEVAAAVAGEDADD